MPDKLIVVDITDREYLTIDGNSEVKEVRGDGKLIVKNPSEKSRLWNLNCDLKEIINTTFPSRVLNIGTLNPGQDFNLDYEIQNIKSTCLKVVETFDTDRDTPNVINNSFLFGNENKCKLHIRLRNLLDLPLLNVKAGREIPTFFQNIDLIPPNYGEAVIKEQDGRKVLIWDISSLAATTVAELNLEFSVFMDKREDQSLGALVVSYLASNHKKTMINPEVRGLTDSMSGMGREEGANPGTWDCLIEFINESEFQVRLEDVKVSHKIPTGSETVVSETPNKKLNANESWDCKFNVESTNVPELESVIDFTPLFVVIPRVLGEIKRESTLYHVLSVDVQKVINPSEVKAYATSDISIENIISNKGTANINKLQILEEFPQDFIPPTFDKIKIIAESSGESLAIQDRSEYMKNIEKYPNNEDPNLKHQINIEIDNLANLLPPNSNLRMSYPIIARNPKPEVEYELPIIIKANSAVEGTKYVIRTPGVPKVQIKYIKRKLKTLKSIKPGMSEGEFIISIRIQNEGDIELENILVKDKIPEGFTCSDFTPKDVGYQIIESEIQINLAELKGTETLNLNYTCSGEGNYPRSEPQIIVKGRENGETISTPTSNSEMVDVSGSLKGPIFDLFSNIINEVEKGITGEKLFNLIENGRDIIPPGPVLHSLMGFARETKSLGEKVIIGSEQDEIITKLNEFKQKYI